MSLFDSASLVVTPNGVKAGKLYSIKPSDGAGDLDVVRATSATRVNANGLIESVGNNVARLDYSNGSCPSILVEPQRTNLALYSEEFDNANWFKYQVTITSNSTTSPDGYTNADTITDSAVNDLHMAYQNTAFTAGSCTVSCYAKANTLSHAFLQIYDGSNFYASGIFNLTNGTVSGAGSITSAGNGWYRLSLTATVATGTGFSYVGTSNGSSLAYSGSGQSIYIWGYQTEAGSYATSYIPTTASAVTRNADVISKTGISSLIGQTEGTVYFEIQLPNEAAEGGRVLMQIGSGSDRIYFAKESNSQNTFQLATQSSSGYNFVNTSNVTASTVKMAIAYKSGQNAFYLNGTLISTASATANPTSISQIVFGDPTFGNSQTIVKQALLFKTRLTNAQLAQLTTL